MATTRLLQSFHIRGRISKLSPRRHQNASCTIQHGHTSYSDSAHSQPRTPSGNMFSTSTSHSAYSKPRNSSNVATPNSKGTTCTGIYSVYRALTAFVIMQIQNSPKMATASAEIPSNSSTSPASTKTSCNSSKLHRIQKFCKMTCTSSLNKCANQDALITTLVRFIVQTIFLHLSAPPDATDPLKSHTFPSIAQQPHYTFNQTIHLDLSTSAPHCYQPYWSTPIYVGR